MEQRFSEQEASSIIQQAAEIQARLAPQSAPIKSGLTESEIVNIAKELGITEASVSEALKSPRLVSTSDTGSMTAAVRSIERSLPGFPETKAFEIVLDEMAPATGSQGRPSVVGNALTYTSSVALSYCEMRVTRSDERTRLRVDVATQLPSIVIGLPVGFITFATAISAGKLSSFLGLSGTMAGILIAAVGALGIWQIVRRVNKWSNKKVVERIEAVVRRFESEAQFNQSQGESNGK